MIHFVLRLGESSGACKQYFWKVFTFGKRNNLEVMFHKANTWFGFSFSIWNDGAAKFEFALAKYEIEFDFYRQAYWDYEKNKSK